MRRRAVVLSLIAVLSLVGLIAGPAGAKGATRTPFTMEQTSLVVEYEGTLNHVGDVRGAVYTGDIESSDPRVAGWITTVANVSWIKLGRTQFNFEAHMWGTFIIENAQGSWEGTWTGSRGPDWWTGVHIIDSVGRGTGAYEGLHIRFHWEGIDLFAGTGEILEPDRH